MHVKFGSLAIGVGLRVEPRHYNTVLQLKLAHSIVAPAARAALLRTSEHTPAHTLASSIFMAGPAFRTRARVASQIMIRSQAVGDAPCVTAWKLFSLVGTASV